METEVVLVYCLWCHVEPLSWFLNSPMVFICLFLFCYVVFVAPEEFTTMVANKELEKARAYSNQVPWDRQLYISSEDCGLNFRWKHLQTTPTHFFWAELSRLLGEKIPVAIMRLEPWTSGSVVQRFNHLATKQPHWRSKRSWIKTAVHSSSS